MVFNRFFLSVFVLGLLTVGTNGLLGAADSASDLAKQVQNPVSDLISCPFQNNTNFRYSPKNEVQNILNIQPVFPFHITKEWNLIIRTIMPVISNPWPVRAAGIGDINLSLFLSPSKPSEFIWGVGPIFQFPSGTSLTIDKEHIDALGYGKWCLGPTAVALYAKGPWVVGALINNIWSVAGKRYYDKVNQMLIQPFINYNFPKGWFFSISPIITANWEAPKKDRWVVPLGGGFGRVFAISKQNFSATVQGYYNIVKPSYGPAWQLRVQIALLFPK